MYYRLFFNLILGRLICHNHYIVKTSQLKLQATWILSNFFRNERPPYQEPFPLVSGRPVGPRAMCFPPLTQCTMSASLSYHLAAPTCHDLVLDAYTVYAYKHKLSMTKIYSYRV